MRERHKPECPAAPPDRARVRELLEELVAAYEAGVNTHRHPAQNELGELCGPMGFYILVMHPPDRQVSEAQFEDMVEALMRVAGEK